jgi:hypothetical protein
MWAFLATAERSEDPARFDPRSIGRESAAWEPESLPGQEADRNSRERLLGILGQAAAGLVAKTDRAEFADQTGRN